MITLTYPVTIAREHKFADDDALIDYMYQTFNLEKFDGGINNGFRALNFIGSEKDESAFMSQPNARAADLKELAGFDVQFEQK